MPGRTDTTKNDTLGIPETSADRDELQLGCDICKGSCAVKETLLFWRIGDEFKVAHIDCGLPPVRVPS